MMKRLLTSLPIGIVLADMLYGLGINISQSLDLHQAKAGDSSITPDIAFSSLQLISNGGMIAIIGFGLVVLLQLNLSVLKRRILPIGIFRTLGLLAVLAFSVPALWEWFWALQAFVMGQSVFNFSNSRYLIAAFCLPLIALLCVWRLWGWYRLHKTSAPEPVVKAAEKQPKHTEKPLKSTLKR